MGWRSNLYFDLGGFFNFAKFNVEGDAKFKEKFEVSNKNIFDNLMQSGAEIELGFSLVSPMGIGGNIFIYDAGGWSFGGGENNSNKDDEAENRFGVGMGIFYDFGSLLI